MTKQDGMLWDFMPGVIASSLALGLVRQPWATLVAGKSYKVFLLDTEGGNYHLIFNNWNNGQQLPDYDITATRDFFFRLTSTTVTEVTPAVAGDVNGDGEVTGSDVTALYNHILFGQDTEIFNGDQNGDGEVTGSDVTAVYNIILGL